MELKELLNKPLPNIPPEISGQIGKSEISKTLFENKNDILKNPVLQKRTVTSKWAMALILCQWSVR